MMISFIILTIALTGLIFVCRFLWKNGSRFRRMSINLCIGFFALGYTLLALEYAFSSFVKISDGFGFTLAAKKWNETYWKPINSMGYRDKEHPWNEDLGTRILFVVGDSFAAGHGIKDVCNRFSDVLARKLGARWEVVVLARNGWQTDREYEAMTRYPKKPDRIIVSYCLNDIYSAAVREGAPLPELVRRPGPFIRPLVDHSHLFNFVYWRAYRSLRSATDQYWKYLNKAYQTEKVWLAHTKELSSMLNYAADANADICFLIWPHLGDPSVSQGITEKVARFLADSGALVLDLTPHLRNRKPHEMMVNSMDGHPNERLHAEVAELLYRKMEPWEGSASAVE
ncbi:MAG: SGNH/GDSL hydrolase family protein [Deltaproteobacteria bacterium]|nr:SGNH/GDSL hydrolase family protein [Deltaproteobacteria bacterium]